MSELAKPQNPTSKEAGCEVAPFQLRTNSTPQILPQETWYRMGGRSERRVTTFVCFGTMAGRMPGFPASRTSS